MSQDECSYLSLRNALVNSEDDYLAACLAVTMTKLTVKAKKNLSLSFKSMSVDSILIICSMLKERQATQGKDTMQVKRIRRTDQDSLQRMQLCLKVLTKPEGLKQLSQVQKVLVDEGKAIFAKFLEINSKVSVFN